MRRNFQPPVQESLPNNRADIGIVVLGLGRKDLVAELAAESTFWPRRLQPSRDLSGIIRASAALIEATIPLEPSVGIGIADPSTALPHAQRAATFHAILVDFGAIGCRRELLGGQVLDPIRMDTVLENVGRFIRHVGYGTCDGAVVCPTKASGPQHFLRSPIGLKILEHCLDRFSARETQLSGGLVSLRQGMRLAVDLDRRRREGRRILVDLLLLRLEANLVRPSGFRQTRLLRFGLLALRGLLVLLRGGGPERSQKLLRAGNGLIPLRLGAVVGRPLGSLEGLDALGEQLPDLRLLEHGHVDISLHLVDRGQDVHASLGIRGDGIDCRLGQVLRESAYSCGGHNVSRTPRPLSQ